VENSCILVADDNELVMTLLTELLENHGYHVKQAADGGEAVEIVKQGQIDMAILDIKMPVLDGLESLRRIKKIDENLPVLMITGDGDGGEVRRTLVEYGAFGCITKPFRILEVMKAIQGVLQSQKRENQFNARARAFIQS
jgi:CheY-like chemotaxis protein